MIWYKLFRAVRLLLLFLIFLLPFAPEWPTFGEDRYKIRTVIGLREFDYLTWLTNASTVKGEAILAGEHSYLDEASRKQFVLDFLTRMQEIQQLEADIQASYINPDVEEPQFASLELQLTLQEKRAQLAAIQPLAEAIVQAQVGAILVEEGFGIAGQPWPPVMMHMTPLPSLMIVSARDRIERLDGFSLVTGLTIPEMDEMETAVFSTVDKSALIVPIGGMGTYPAMIVETSSVHWLIEITAHEWAHHWMGFYPVGINYSLDPQIRIINETVAATIDREIANRVVARYYPELYIPPPPQSDPTPTATPDPSQPPVFDFRAEMAMTRMTVDAMLAEGNILGAEAYMETRRRFFVENGYGIRKLNQAYFAFYGAYASEPGGASAGDPIGPLVREVRQHSSTLRAFMDHISEVEDFQTLVDLAANLRSR